MSPCPTGALWRLSARRDRDAAAPPALEAAMTGGGRPGWLARVRAAVTDPDSLRSWSLIANDGIIATAGILEGFAGAGASHATLVTAAASATVAGMVNAGGAEWAEEAAEREAHLSAAEEEAADLARHPRGQVPRRCRAGRGRVGRRVCPRRGHPARDHSLGPSGGRDLGDPCRRARVAHGDVDRWRAHRAHERAAHAHADARRRHRDADRQLPRRQAGLLTAVGQSRGCGPAVGTYRRRARPHHAPRRARRPPIIKLRGRPAGSAAGTSIGHTRSSVSEYRLIQR